MSIVSATALTVASLVAQLPAASTGGNHEGAPRIYLTPEVLSLHPTFDFDPRFRVGWLFRFGSIDLQYGRLRIGTSLIDATTWTFLPVRLGYTIWQRPHRYVGHLYGMRPEVYAQASGSLWPWSFDPPPAVRFVGFTWLRAGADIFGVGVSVGVGVGAAYSSGPAGEPPYVYSWSAGPAADISLRLGVTNFGFDP